MTYLRPPRPRICGFSPTNHRGTFLSCSSLVIKDANRIRPVSRSKAKQRASTNDAICQLTFTIGTGSYRPVIDSAISSESESRPPLITNTTTSSLSPPSPIGNRNHGGLHPSRTNPLVRRRHPSQSLRPPCNLLRRHRRKTEAPRPQLLKIHLQDLRPDVLARAPAHSNRIRTTLRLCTPIPDNSALGHHMSSRVILYWYRSALLSGNAGLDYGGYYV